MFSTNERKIIGIAILALLFALISYNMSNSISSGNNTTYNNYSCNCSNFSFNNDTSVNNFNLTNISNIYIRNLHNYFDNFHIHMNQTGTGAAIIYKEATNSYDNITFFNGLLELRTTSKLIDYYNAIKIYPNEVDFFDNGTERLSVNGTIKAYTDIDINNNRILNYNFISSGNYIGDATNNRFIPYNLSGRNATKININSNRTPIYMGEIIEPGYIYSQKDGTSTSVTAHNSTGFYVSGNYNLNGTGSNVSVIGGTITNESNLAGYIRYMPVVAGASGNLITVGLNSQSANLNARMALYTDSSGNPGSLLNETSSFAISTNWTNVSLIIPVTTGTTYWLAFQVNSNTEFIYKINTGTMKYQAQAYGSFPASASGLSTTTSTYNMQLTIDSPIIKYYWVAE
jgi:hypothetical protein